MERIRRILTDQIRVNPSDPPNPWSIFIQTRELQSFARITATDLMRACHLAATLSLRYRTDDQCHAKLPKDRSLHYKTGSSPVINVRGSSNGERRSRAKK